MYKLLFPTKKFHSPLTYVFIATLFLSIHYFLITYINSTYLKQFVNDDTVGLLYAIGSLVNIFLFIKMPSITSRLGNYKTILLISVIEIISIATLSFADEKSTAILAFIMHHAFNPLILLGLDIYIEDYTKSKDMGKMRGIFLSVMSLASIISPLIVSGILSETTGGFEAVYILSAIFMFLFFITVRHGFRNIKSGVFKEIKIIKELREFFYSKNIVIAGYLNFTLNLFYSFMIVFTPLYLIEIGGFNWSQIGLIISVSLIPFLLLEIPVGDLSDKKYGEKEFLIAGFIIAGISTLYISNIDAGNLLGFMTVLFMTRVGASIIEVANESYFFKKAKGRDELISIFRITTPIAFIIGPSIGGLILKAYGWSAMFPTLGIIMILSIIPSFLIKDTK